MQGLSLLPHSTQTGTLSAQLQLRSCACNSAGALHRFLQIAY